jgi:hypothetical protein
MTTKIDKKITGFGVRNEQDEAAKAKVLAAEKEAHKKQNIEHMNENLGRPEMLVGSTYKIKPPMADCALYITINDIVLNPGSEHEMRRPFEVFLNSKNMDHFQWVVALTRVMSAVFRKGGDVTFLVEELKNVFDPQGGYFKPGGRFMPSLVAEIGYAIETHLKTIGLLQTEEMSEHQRKILDEKREEYIEKKGEVVKDDEFPATAQLCMKCHTKATIIMDGCVTCLNCGDSKCS